MARIGIDYDDTLFSVFPVWVQTYNRLTGSAKDVKHVQNWKFEPAFDAWELPYMYAVRTPDMYSRVMPMIGAKHAIRAMLNAGHKVVVISSDTLDFYPAKFTALDTFFPELAGNLVLTKESKWSYGIDELVDDGPHNNPTILFSCNHNRSFGHPQRADNWDEVCQFLGLPVARV